MDRYRISGNIKKGVAMASLPGNKEVFTGAPGGSVS